MTNANLSIVGHEKEVTSFRERIDTILENRRKELVSIVEEWMSLYAKLNKTKLPLDDCPIPMTKEDQDYVIQWLDDNSFKVSKPRLMGRLMINLERSEG